MVILNNWMTNSVLFMDNTISGRTLARARCPGSSALLFIAILRCRTQSSSVLPCWRLLSTTIDAISPYKL
jgi:hypothetical protein